MRDDEDALVRMLLDDLQQCRQRAGGHRQSAFPVGRREGVRIVFVARVFFRKLLLDLGAGLPFPAAVCDFAQAVDRRDLQSVRGGDERGRVHRPRHRAGERDVERIGREPFAEQPRLLASFVGQFYIDGSCETILGRQLGRAVANEVNARAHRCAES